jgi:penicillin-binding protein 1A
MGMVPNLVTGVWVGAEDRSVHFDNITYGQGATMALPIWANYMRRNYQDSLGISLEDFERPDRMSFNLDCSESDEALEEIDLEVEADLEEFDF